jgi:hypothetical protein
VSVAANNKIFGGNRKRDKEGPRARLKQVVDIESVAVRRVLRGAACVASRLSRWASRFWRAACCFQPLQRQSGLCILRILIQ